MTNTDHSLEPSWNSQINKAAKLFGSNGTEAAIGYSDSNMMVMEILAQAL